MTSQLEEVLSKRKQRLEEEAKLWESSRARWLKRLDNLFGTVKEWLKPLEEKGYITIETSEIGITEEVLGTYRAPSMTISFFGGESIRLVPKGLHVIGGKGRVDMKLGLREVMIVGREDESGWFFAERVGHAKPRQFEFNRDHFEKLLREYLESA